MKGFSRYCGALRWDFQPFNADVFNLRSFDLSSFDLRPRLGLPPSIQSHSPLCNCTSIATHSSLTDVSLKKAYSHSLVFTRDTRNRHNEGAQVRLTCSIFEQGAMDRTSCQDELLRSIYIKILPLVGRCASSKASSDCRNEQQYFKGQSQ